MEVKASVNHGGNVHAAARELRRSISAIVDFSASINPLGPSPAVRRTLANAASFIQHYPDPDCHKLREALASRWKLSPGQFVIGNGSTELIDMIPRALAIRSALIAGPTFSEYAGALHRAGARSIILPAARSEDYRPPLQKMSAYLQRQRAGRAAVDAVFICNPNSPTGQICDPADLRALIKKADHSNAWTILDETFIEYCEDQSMLPWLARYPRLILLRSFTKFYALPGLRIGYSISSSRTAAALRHAQPPWSVNVLAQRAAEAALGDRGHARRTLRYLRRERARLRAELFSLPGLTLFPSHGNFLLLELPKPHRAWVVAAHLRRQGLLIRDCSLVPGFTERTIRVAVRTRSENERLIAGFAKILGSCT